MCGPVSLSKLTLVLGGAASGKSDFAEMLAHDTGLPRSYIATAQAFDDEMRNVILIDCLTLWLSNLLLADQNITEIHKDLLNATQKIDDPVICVSNEVGLGLVPDTPLGRKFREAQGRLNREIAAKADLVVLVTAGIPQAIKGQLP